MKCSWCDVEAKYAPPHSDIRFCDDHVSKMVAANEYCHICSKKITNLRKRFHSVESYYCEKCYLELCADEYQHPFRYKCMKCGDFTREKWYYCQWCMTNSGIKCYNCHEKPIEGFVWLTKKKEFAWFCDSDECFQGVTS